MYLSKLNIWNFRKFGSGNNDLNLSQPDLEVPFTKGLNILIGENDSGKTAIIDAIKLVLKTHSAEWINLDHDDFFNDASRLRIECVFYDFKDDEAKYFIEWLTWEGEGENVTPFLKVFIDATRKNGRLPSLDVRAGLDEDGFILNAEAKDFLKTTYLKPLRDARAELIPRKNSRLSQILQGHEAFKGKNDDHYLVERFEEFNESIKKYFEGKKNDDTELTEDQFGKLLKEQIDKYLDLFSKKESLFKVSDANLKQILERLELAFKDEKNLGLGSHNLLFISSELLHLNKKDWDGLRLGLVEEIEAHLHPQVQLQVIESLQKEKNIQLIFTTHSPNLGSKVDLKNLIICHGNNVYPMGKDYTKLEEPDYNFLQRFLDVTKANLFFARGVILVEGWAEELLLPALAKRTGINLTEKGVSIVNIANTAFLRYSKIFQRKDGKEFKIPVSVITDLDIKPEEENIDVNGQLKKDVQKGKKEKYNGGSVKTFVSPHWTLEYCIALSPHLSKHLFEAVKKAGAEMEQDGYSGKAIGDTWEVFSNGKDAETIAGDIYIQFIGDGKKISKSIIAQHFAEIISRLSNEELSQENLLADSNIKYLVDAIKYASGNN